MVTGDVNGEDERISASEWFFFVLEARNGEEFSGLHDRLVMEDKRKQSGRRRRSLKGFYMRFGFSTFRDSGDRA